jgi:glutamate/tyrosine decarboxylase-like PLP-dependent enzyme
MATTRTLVGGLRELGLPPVVEPDMSVFAARSETLDVRGVAAGLHERGWWMDLQQDPDALHFVVMHRHAAVAERFLADASAVAADPPTAGRARGGGYGVMVRHDSGGADPIEVLSRYLDGRYDFSP